MSTRLPLTYTLAVVALEGETTLVVGFAGDDVLAVELQVTVAEFELVLLRPSGSAVDEV